MQLGGSEKLGRMSRGILRAARARRELREESVVSTVIENAPDSGVRVIGEEVAAAAMGQVDKAEMIH